ncbi:MAG: outer membrane lipoprotein carrier protein LolA [Pseudomonadota bacterium]|nr:outer membrane lipoprotein carrier protein LolA [Pseudomonadota bacterium]
MLPLALGAHRACSAVPADQHAANAAGLIARSEDYLNGLHALRARFLQVAPNGAVSRGVAWLERPGRMRFEYDQPVPLLLVASHGLIVFHDSKLNQTSNIPLGSTPLGILLEGHIKLTGDGVTVANVRQLPQEVQLTLVRAGRSGEGSLTLTFSENPLALRQWSVTDAQGQQTSVTLYNIQTGGSFDQKLFDVVGPMVNPNTAGGGAG